MRIDEKELTGVQAVSGYLCDIGNRIGILSALIDQAEELKLDDLSYRLGLSGLLADIRDDVFELCDRTSGTEERIENHDN